jgi:uncharacterized membrane protein (UPF0182 family)
MGTAKGTMNLLMTEYMGASKGTIPTFATNKARAMVANGAERAFPTTVRRSNDIPNVLSSSIADKQ